MSDKPKNSYVVFLADGQAVALPTAAQSYVYEDELRFLNKDGVVVAHFATGFWSEVYNVPYCEGFQRGKVGDWLKRRMNEPNIME